MEPDVGETFSFLRGPGVVLDKDNVFRKNHAKSKRLVGGREDSMCPSPVSDAAYHLLPGLEAFARIRATKRPQQ